ncbi:MAG: DUF3127 domain-containing protein [Flavobacteriaceae bacterium]|jgi:hypothetical protein|nr:DUF3127 domain-containing protein [Flavobacteriaceae bacterium]
MEQTGFLFSKSEIKEFGESKFRVQDFILDCKRYDSFTGEPRENFLKFQLTGEKIALLENIQIGQRMKVFFMPEGRFYEKKDMHEQPTGEKGHIQNFRVWKIELPENQPTPKKNDDVPTTASKSNNVYEAMGVEKNAEPETIVEESDLPF